MMYVEFMKNFHLADSSELLAVRLILASWAKNVWFLLSRHDVRRVHEKFSSRRFERTDGCSSHFGILSPKTFDFHFLHMMYVEFMKNFLLAYSSELMAVRVISASWTQKRLIPTFYTWCTSSSWKMFLWPIRASYWLLYSFWLPDQKTFDSYFLDMMYVEFIKNFLLSDSTELLAVRLILTSWTQKRLIPTF